MLSYSVVHMYWRESRGFGDFARLLRVRLSQSKVGPLVCPRPITVDVDLLSLGRDVRLRSHTTDISVLGELLSGGAYRPVAMAVEGEPSVIVDLGANTGLAARWFLERFPATRVVCVEPDPGNVAMLRDNVAGYGGRATVIAAAVGGRARRAGLNSSRGEWGSKITEPVESTDDRIVDVVTMETVLAAVPNTIDLLKCDIEGAEQELFESCASWIPRIRLAAVECHHPYRENDLLDTIRLNGAEVDVLVSESTPQFGCDSVVFRVRPQGGS